ncbi:MAG: hypothetical protein COB46_10025 [Rhodospirillaceae bacterium]|nr:MAG: hypothetical protein COB46_10025 [Rhodospirillaceae bacterium]
MDFGMFISLVAIAIALGALWVAGDALGKIEDQTQVILQSHIQPLRADVQKITQHLNKIQKSIGSANGTEKDLQHRFTRQDEIVAELEDRVVKLRQDLDAFDKSIPGRYRVAPGRKATKSRVDPSFQ